MNNIILEKKIGDYNIKVINSKCNPRDYRYCTFMFTHTRLNVVDETDEDLDHSREYVSINIDNKNSDYIILPVYMYEHEGYKLSLTPFEDKLNSALLGYAIVEKNKIRNEESLSYKNLLEFATDWVNTELNEYECYMNDTVYEILVSNKTGVVSIDTVFGDIALDKVITKLTNKYTNEINK